MPSWGLRQASRASDLDLGVPCARNPIIKPLSVRCNHWNLCQPRPSFPPRLALTLLVQSNPQLEEAADGDTIHLAISVGSGTGASHVPVTHASTSTSVENASQRTTLQCLVPLEVGSPLMLKGHRTNNPVMASSNQ